MATATAIPTRRLISVDGLRALFEALVADGYHVIDAADVLGRVPNEEGSRLHLSRITIAR